MTAIQDLVLTFCSTVRPVLSVFLITRDFEVESKCEGTLHDAY